METLNASAVYGDTEHECIDVIGVYGDTECECSVWRH